MTYTLAFPAPRLRTDLNRLMDDFFGPIAGEPAGWTPRAVTRELGDRWELELELPGVNPEHIETVAEGTTLTVRGERRNAEGKAIASFRRVFTLPEGADAEGISARSQFGILTLVIPKRAQAVARKITVATA